MYIHFVYKFSHLRKNVGLNQSQIARQLNVTRECVSQWERGLRKPNINMLPRLAKLLNCSIEEIVLCFCDEDTIKEAL